MDFSTFFFFHATIDFPAVKCYSEGEGDSERVRRATRRVSEGLRGRPGEGIHSLTFRQAVVYRYICI